MVSGFVGNGVLGGSVLMFLFRLHRPAYNVTFNVTNTGGLYGGDVRLLVGVSLKLLTNNT